MKSLLAVIIFLLMVTSSYGNPYLTANSIEDVDYFIFSIDGNEVSISPNLNMDFLYDLKDLKDGTHILEIIGGSIELGEGVPTKIYLIKDTKKQWIFYTIKPDPEQKDANYLLRFDEPLRIKIPAP